VLLWAAALAAVALIALLVVALTIDPDAYRPAVQRELTQALGRDVSIERLSFAVSLRPTVAMRGLRIANPPWASRPHLLTADEGAVRIDLIALWRGRIEIGNLAIAGVDLLLERDGNGVGNWMLGRAHRDENGRDTRRLPDFDAISFQNIQVGLRGPDGTITSTRIDEATAVVRTDRPFELRARAVYRQTPLTAELKANASLQSALEGQPIAAAVAVQGPDAQADLEIAVGSAHQRGQCYTL
jgi:uncharacterized protein involved in outer membrane biogenesis